MRILVITWLLATLPCSLLFSQDSTWFADVTDTTGLDGISALRINSVDINQDKYPDLIVLTNYNQRNNIRVFLNQQHPASSNATDRQFVEWTDSSGVNIHPDYPDSSYRADIITLADVNNDSVPDLITGTWHWSQASINFPQDRPSVLLNDGTGRFTHVPNNGFSALGSISIAGLTYLDYNQDGNIDVYVATFSDDHPNTQFRADVLMKGNGDGTFTNVTSPFDIGVIQFPMYGSSAVDWNNDGWTDILTSPYCRSGGTLWRNNGNNTFSDVSTVRGYNAQTMTGDNGQDLCQWGAFPYDYDNDGDMDVLHVLVHGGIDPGEGRTTIAKNLGPGNNYTLQWDLNVLNRVFPQSSHLGNMDATWLDMDNDMWVDLMVTETEYQPNSDRAFFYRQDSANLLQDITPDLGLLLVKSPHSVESFDFDLDGDYDLVMNRRLNNTELQILENNIGNQNNWIAVNPVAPAGVNANCIGARIVVHAGGVRQMREIHAGVGHFTGQQPFTPIFGLGAETTVDSIVVTWPSQLYPNSTAYNVPVNQVFDFPLNPPTSAENMVQPARLVVWPNPSGGNVRIAGDLLRHPDLKWSLQDIRGKQFSVDPQPESAGVYSLQIENLPNGVYFITVANPTEITTEKIVIRK